MQDFFVTLASLFMILLFCYGACALVQVTLIRPQMRYVVIGLFTTAGVLIGLRGLLLVSLPALQNPREGQLYLALAAATLLPLLAPPRRLLARITPFDPDSTVDLSGLVGLLWIFALFGPALFTVDLEAIASQVQITVAYSLLSAFALPALAFSLVGVFVTRDWREAAKRLGLERVTVRQALIAVALVVPLVVLNVGVDTAGRALQPELYEQLQGVLRAMSSNITSPLVALVIGLSAGIGEEILLRGAVQPRFGIGLTALAFAVAHTQYGASYAIVYIFVAGVVFGYERKYFNTTACIITHGVYDIVALGLNYLAGAGG